jgi:transcriptional regulator
MYVPAHFEETRLEVLHDLVRNHPLATIVTLDRAGGLNANHIPLELDAESPSLGTLRGHVSRANSMWRDYSRDVAALVIFQGPEIYITPSWYQTKQESGKVVPTWNYAVVHAYGPLRIVEDPSWLRALVERLTDRHEAPRPEPWEVADAPDDYIEGQLRGIVGIEISIERLIGKWKVSQNRPEADREGISKGLQEMGKPDGSRMAHLVDRARCE